MFQGSITALITPFIDGKVDDKTFIKLLERQIESGTHAVVTTGTTGESPTLSHAEHQAITELCIKNTRGRIPVIAGTGSNSTAEAIMSTKHAQEAGADAALIMTPYYNKPTQEGIFQHFKAIHDATNIPILIYNIPGRCIVDINDETIKHISELSNVIGIKDATGDLSRPESFKNLGVKKEFIQLSGDDESAVDFNKLGGVGAISVTSNIAPELCSKMQSACLENDYSTAQAIQDKLMNLHEVMFCETSPNPVKYAMSLMGLCSGEMRLPLLAPSNENQSKIRAVLSEMNII